MQFSILVALFSVFIGWQMWFIVAPGAVLWITIAATILVLLINTLAVATDDRLQHNIKKLRGHPSAVSARIREGMRRAQERQQLRREYEDGEP